MQRAAKFRGSRIALRSSEKNNFSIVRLSLFADTRGPNSELQSICCIIVTSSGKDGVDGILGRSSRDERCDFICSAVIAAGYPDENDQKNS
jgi:hypothetical protein